MNDFNKSQFVGKRVEQVRCVSPEYQRFVGRKGVIVDAMVDEKGTIHAQTDDGVWCPFHLLAVESSSPLNRTEEDEGPTSQPEDPPPSKDFEGGF